MGTLRDTVHIEAPIESVWELATDPDRFIEWETRLLEVRDIDGPLDHPGAGYTAVYRLAGRTLARRWQLRTVDRPNRLELESTSSGPGTFTIRLEPSGSGTNLSYAFEYALPGGFVGEIIDRLFVGGQVRRDFRRDYRNFRTLCEARAAADA